MRQHLSPPSPHSRKKRFSYRIEQQLLLLRQLQLSPLRAAAARRCCCCCARRTNFQISSWPRVIKAIAVHTKQGGGATPLIFVKRSLSPRSPLSLSLPPSPPPPWSSIGFLCFVRILSKLTVINEQSVRIPYHSLTLLFLFERYQCEK